MEENRFDAYRKSRFGYIVEAAVEYFIHLCVTATFLTAILNEIGVSSALQGIVGSIASLAYSAQLLAVFFVRKTYPCKRWVSVLNLISQLMFALMYCVPLVDISPTVKIIAVVLFLLLAYGLQNYLTPSRTSWHMSLVEDNKRGVFSANKEIVSLVSGMAFSQCAGILMDYFRERGEVQTCFIIFACTITVLSFLHLYIMLSIKEPEPLVLTPPKKARDILRMVLGNGNLRTVILFDVLYEISVVSMNFSAVYIKNDLGYSYAQITLITAIGATLRAIVSRPLGRFADRHSWVTLMRLCMTVSATAFLIYAFCTPTNKWLYILFYLLYSFSMGGTNSGRMNLCFDYVAREDRRYILGIKATISGLVGFGTSLLAAVLVGYIEGNGNVLFGISLYPQQLLFGITTVMLVALNLFFLPRLQKQKAPAQE
ncbi:MAG: MFS transporter [Clostridia bacterium]|nr:MFS transporter [Clostridia bacterium]